MGKRRKREGMKLWQIVMLCLVYLFLYLPIVVVMLFSFNKSELNVNFTGFTTNWYRVLFEQRKDLWDALWTSLELGGISTVLSCIIGTAATIGMHRYNFRLKKFINNILYIPLVIPEIVIGIAFLASLSMIGISMSMTTLVISHVTFCIPFVIITLRSRIAGFDASIEEAAMDLGANQIHTLMRVTIPMLVPGIVAGGLLSFTLSIDDVVISFFAAGPDQVTLPIKIYGMVRSKFTPDVYALCTIIMIGTIVIYGGIQFLQEKMAARRGENI
ncbi:MAG: ABC transporter permease [Lachnospiraceae bacterium]|nr:ABC transporter permease [Lachnospiraceae bacterium]HCJ09188.1 ABC transporter permease [Lachnospiraceae bacterium]